MSRRNSGRAAAAFRNHYKTASRLGDWVLCKQIAEQMRGLDDSAETQYALGYALEHLGDLDEARKVYQMVLIIDSRLEKARARLRSLAIASSR